MYIGRWKKKQVLGPVFFLHMDLRLQDDFDLCSLVSLECVLYMVAVLSQLLAVHKDAASFLAVTERQGLVLI